MKKPIMGSDHSVCLCFRIQWHNVKLDVSRWCLCRRKPNVNEPLMHESSVNTISSLWSMIFQLTFSSLYNVNLAPEHMYHSWSCRWIIFIFKEFHFFSDLNLNPDIISFERTITTCQHMSLQTINIQILYSFLQQTCSTSNFMPCKTFG